MIVLTISLNGTDINPFHKMGLKCNPFPQFAKYECQGAVMHLQQLGADPVPDTNHIRDHLKGWSEELVNLCCSKFEKGKMIKFDVEFEE